MCFNSVNCRVKHQGTKVVGRNYRMSECIEKMILTKALRNLWVKSTIYELDVMCGESSDSEKYLGVMKDAMGLKEQI